MGREQIMKRQQELVNKAKAENRDLTAEEQAEFDGLQKALDFLDNNEGQNGTGQEQRNFTVTAGESATEGGAVHSTPEEIAARAIENERRRTADITELCRTFRMDPNEYILTGKSLEETRAAVLKRLQENNGPVGARVTADEEDKFRDCVSDALMIRAGVTVSNPAPGSSDFRNMRLRDLAVECLTRSGEDTRTLLKASADDLYETLCRQFYNPMSSFPAILDNTIKKSIVKLYEQVPTTFQVWTTKGSLSDFKETADHEYVIGGMGDFEKVPENGELKADMPRTERLPSRKVDTYGKQFSMTRQAFINDDIGFLTEMPGLYATKAKMTLDKQVYSLLFNNRKIFDGVNLFDQKHNNVMETGGKPSQESIQKMILQMQKQKDQFGEPIYVTPQYIIVPVGYEFDLAVILHSTQVTGSANNDINPLYNYPIQIVQTPVLNALAGEKACPWFMVANPMSVKHIHIDYLNGQETPIVRRMEAAGTLGFTWDVYTDWGISVRDFRGIAKNPGEVIA